MKIIQQRERIERVEYRLFFESEKIPGAGFAYVCDAEGNVATEVLEPCARAGYEDLLRDRTGYHAPVVEETKSAYTQPRIGLCDDCGEEVYLDRFTNACDCGADYNMSGDRLAPRAFWGEETGESVDDILRIR